MNDFEKARIIQEEIWSIALTQVSQEAIDDFQSFLNTAKFPLEALKHSYKFFCELHDVDIKQHLLDL